LECPGFLAGNPGREGVNPVGTMRQLDPFFPVGRIISTSLAEGKRVPIRPPLYC